MLRKLVSKFVLIAMLFTVFSTTVNAGLLYSKSLVQPSNCIESMLCCPTMQMHKMTDSPSISSTDICDSHSSSMGEPSSAITQCCSDADCHSQVSPIAILPSFSFSPENTHIDHFIEPQGQLFTRNEPILRPPVFI
ncbi:hypothetical protein C9J12_06145 [Photobacterium frigidiphilum]|uniref:Uncharacterized protein n=1 Tax=Photobacterium frigidiphilum TaxID=264736 RepID=A0A2T3JMY1_9GAMM|nr:hypothetical protein C9J12_06145 [Photobacterium frigidiphilum]